MEQSKKYSEFEYKKVLKILEYLGQLLSVSCPGVTLNIATFEESFELCNATTLREMALKNSFTGMDMICARVLIGENQDELLTFTMKQTTSNCVVSYDADLRDRFYEKLGENKTFNGSEWEPVVAHFIKKAYILIDNKICA